MAVYTAISQQQMQQLCAQFQLGTWRSHTPISEGMENSNYCLNCDNGEDRLEPVTEYIVTVFEELSLAELPVYITLLNNYAELGLPVNAPIANQQGEYFIAMTDKPLMICHKLPGQHIENPSLAQCQAIGSHLAKLHLANQQTAFAQPPLQTFNGIRDNIWLLHLFTHQQHLLPSADLPAAQKCLVQLKSFEKRDLPQGIIHADLFRDNALFVGDALSGLLDFYSASRGYYIFDLAVVINDWGAFAGKPSIVHQQALINAYELLRPLTQDEKAVLPHFLCIAALRFYLSRIITANKKRNHDNKPIGVDKNAEAMRDLFYNRLDGSN